MDWGTRGYLLICHCLSVFSSIRTSTPLTSAYLKIGSKNNRTMVGELNQKKIR